jgi:hypothetical protein
MGKSAKYIPGKGWEIQYYDQSEPYHNDLKEGRGAFLWGIGCLGAIILGIVLWVVL